MHNDLNPPVFAVFFSDFAGGMDVLREQKR